MVIMGNGLRLGELIFILRSVMTNTHVDNKEIVGVLSKKRDKSLRGGTSIAYTTTAMQKLNFP